MDDEMQAVFYVETTAGFEKAKPIINHIHIKFKPAQTFRIANPGEDTNSALKRLGWQPRDNPMAIYKEFRDNLADRCNREPFKPFRDSVENVE